MTAAPASLSFAPDIPFKFVAGDPALDLVNTVDWTDDGPIADRLGDYERLIAWAEATGLVAPAVVRRLRRAASLRPRDAAEALGTMRRTRWVIRRAAMAFAAGQPSTTALADFNELLPSALRRLRLVPARSRAPGAPPVRHEWAGAAETLESPLWPVLWSATQLFMSADADRIRVCPGEDCGWVYVDRSRNGMRRWCEMETCGTRAKNRRRADSR